MPPIKHIVLSGGGPTGLMLFGAAKKLAQEGFWRLADIQSIYGCSIGAFVGVVLALDIEWAWLDDYFIQRPWDKLVTQNVNDLFNCFAARGLLGEEVISQALKPLLATRDLAHNITLAELYAHTHIDVHMFATDINQTTMTKVDISHLTHPDLPVVKALAMSMAFPMVFRPVIWESGCYVDGGFLANYPLEECLAAKQPAADEVLGLEVTYNQSTVAEPITANHNLFDVFMATIRSMVMALAQPAPSHKIKYHLPCLITNWADLSKWWDVMQKSELRQDMIAQGEAFAQVFWRAHRT